MLEPIFLISALSALVGVFVPALKELVEALRKRQRAEGFFKSSAGKALLKGLDLDRDPDSPAVLFSELADASKKMDSIVKRLQDYAKVRTEAVGQLEGQLEQLTLQEGELRKKVQDLQNVPLPAVEHFASLLNKGEQSSALRDYALFVLGVIVSAIVGIVLKKLGLA
jgi:hypothetical protein